MNYVQNTFWPSGNDSKWVFNNLFWKNPKGTSDNPPPLYGISHEKIPYFFGTPPLSSCHTIDRCCNTFWFVVRLLRMAVMYMNFNVLSEEYLQQSFGDVQCGGGRRGNWPSSVKTAKPAKNLSQNCILSLTLYWTSVKELLYLLLFYHM